LHIHLLHPDGHDVPDGYGIEGMFDVAFAHLGDMHKPVLFHADIDKGAEVHHVADRSLQFHSRLQILEPKDVLSQQRLRQIVPRIPFRTHERIQDIL